MGAVAAPPHTEWPDDRIRELARRVDNAATKEEMASLRRELTERAEGVNRNVNRVGEKVDALAGDPVTEGRQKRAAIVVAIIAALTGVGATTLIYVAGAGGVH